MKKLSEYTINENNPRFISQDKIERLKKSIQDFPKMMSVRPIVVDDNNVILGGNMRFRALQELGYTEVQEDWIQKIDDLTDEQKKEFIIKDNVGFGSWDWDILANEWDNDQLGEWGMDLPDFDGDKVLEAEEDDFDATPLDEPITVLGDLYEIGEHRLLCGDSTDSDQVARLMNGEKADMLFTDPPYDIENEDYHSNIYLFTQNAHVFVMHDDKGIVNYLRLSKLEFSSFYVANFGFASPRGNDPYLSHILISQEKNGNAIAHKDMHDGFRSIIPMEYRFRLKDDKTGHKHQKPIKFISTFIEHFSNLNAIILDLFLGSGSTIVAAHQLKRKCYGIELDTRYCDVIVRRMLKLDPTLTIKRNGKITKDFE
jgi:site-specific DNA-methyltransferase (adenine-specific)